MKIGNTVVVSQFLHLHIPTEIGWLLFSGSDLTAESCRRRVSKLLFIFCNPVGPEFHKLLIQLLIVGGNHGPLSSCTMFPRIKREYRKVGDLAGTAQLPLCFSAR